ncbi:hypothetical protein [Blastococcus sp. SYSU DS0617]
MPLDGPELGPLRVGLVFEQRRTLRATRHALCVADSGSELQLHFSAKETVTVPAAGQSPSELVPVGLSPAGRVLYATRVVAGQVRQDWDPAAMPALVAFLTQEMGARRALAAEALVQQWEDIFQWIGLSPTEKDWLRAHHAASTGQLEELRRHAAALPAGGYAAKVALLKPFLREIGEHPDPWVPVLEGWAQGGVPEAAEVRDLVAGSWDDAVRAAGSLFDRAGQEARADAWRSAAEAIAAEAPQPPPGPGFPAWSAATLYVQGRAGTVLDTVPADVGVLPIPLLDDLVDAGAFTRGIDTRDMPGPVALHLLARVTPDRLDDNALARVGNQAERARRRFLTRDGSGLTALPEGPDVRHYQALLDVVNGTAPDEERLRPSVVHVLGQAAESRAALRSGAASMPPRELLDDPTVWPLFAEEAKDGAISLGQVDRAQFPAFAQWCDLQRLVGLLWEAKWAEAERIGSALIPGLDVERYQDEALNLTAFAVLQQGRPLEALALLERALDGTYTEALLVNTSLIAALEKPATAAKYFAMLVRHAPTPELRRAAINRAVAVWDALPDELTFPAELLQPLREVLSEPSPVGDYLRLLRVARYASSDLVLSLPMPSDERAGVLRTQQARVRFSDDPDYLPADLARAFIAVHREYGRSEWFDSEWDAVVEGFRRATFVDFGKGFGSATFFDTVFVEAPGLLTAFQKLLLLPQAGAHMAAAFAEGTDKTWLNPQAFGKFFFTPCEELLASRATLEPDAFEYLAENMGKCLGIAALSMAGAARDSYADDYNALLGRARWDNENRGQIVQLMRQTLSNCTSQIEQLDRVIDRLRRLPLPTELRKPTLEAVVEVTEDWRSEVVQLRSRL